MFVAIYRCRLHPGREQDLITHWQRITAQGVAAGSGGSSLFKDVQGEWVAIARRAWRTARERFFQSMQDDDADPGLVERAAQALIERLPWQALESVLDGWAPFAGIDGAFRP